MGPGVGFTKPIFSVPLFSHFFPNDQNSGYLYDMKLIFGRCHRRWAAETLGKYEHDWNYLTYTFAKAKFSVTEKLANGALVTPIPELCQYRSDYNPVGSMYDIRMYRRFPTWDQMR